jgi:hypothetical protein
VLRNADGGVRCYRMEDKKKEIKKWGGKREDVRDK